MLINDLLNNPSVVRLLAPRWHPPHLAVPLPAAGPPAQVPPVGAEGAGGGGGGLPGGGRAGGRGGWDGQRGQQLPGGGGEEAAGVRAGAADRNGGEREGGTGKEMNDEGYFMHLLWYSFCVNGAKGPCS